MINYIKLGTMTQLQNDKYYSYVWKTERQDYVSAWAEEAF